MHTQFFGLCMHCWVNSFCAFSGFRYSIQDSTEIYVAYYVFCMSSIYMYTGTFLYEYIYTYTYKINVKWWYNLGQCGKESTYSACLDCMVQYSLKSYSCCGCFLMMIDETLYRITGSTKHEIIMHCLDI